MLKELSVKEALLLLAEKYPEPVEGVAWSIGMKDKLKAQLFGTHGGNSSNPFSTYKGCFERFAIEVSDEYRYMTQQECLNWVCLVGYKGYQVTEESEAGDFWLHPSFFDYIGDGYKYRTIQEIGGRVVYGTAQEFKVKVK
jgi:hypothetical protein